MPLSGSRSLSCRLAREAEHFDGLYSRNQAADLLLLPTSIQRHQSCAEPSIYPRERMISLIQPLAGRDVLEMGCGTGVDAVLLAMNGARVWAYDISSEAVRIAASRIKLHDLDARVDLALAAQPQNAFPGRQYDVIYGHLVLHHLELADLGAELRDLLKPNGVCVFYEPVSLSPISARLRALIPWRSADCTPDERPLGPPELEKLTCVFRHLQVFHYEFLSRGYYLLKRRRAMRWVRSLDVWLLRRLPLFRRFASGAVVYCKT